MTNTLPIQEWLNVIKDEYLDGLVKDGGTSIKFAVPVREYLGPLLKEVFTATASNLGYQVLSVNSGETKVHMPQEIFFRIAEQVDWRMLARRMLLQLCPAYYSTDTIDPQTEAPIIAAIGAANALDESEIALALTRAVSRDIAQNAKMSRDFRVAMTHLCLTEIGGAGQNQEAIPLLEWLTGVNRRVSNVKSYSIYNSITRTNAKYLFESLLYWIRFVGYTGTVVLLNNSRVTLRQNPRDGLLFYSRPAVLDHYELLREFIDGTDRLEGLLMVVLPSSAFLDDDNSRSNKGFGIYDALKGRISDEVRDRSQGNPLSTLVRLADTTI